MKVNWRKGNLLVYRVLAITLFIQMHKSTQNDQTIVEDTNYLVEVDQQEINDKLQNTVTLNEPLKMKYYEGFHLVELQFPKDFTMISGKVRFYRPSSKKMEVTLPVRVDCENIMDIFIRELQFGEWVIEVDWEAHQTQYLHRFTIDVPITIEEDVLTLR